MSKSRIMAAAGVWQRATAASEPLGATSEKQYRELVAQQWPLDDIAASLELNDSQRAALEVVQGTTMGTMEALSACPPKDALTPPAELLHVVADPNDKRVPEVARACLAALGTQLLRLKEQIVEFDRMIMAWHRSNQTSKRLHYIPGVGPMLATALVASVADPRTFRSGRNFSAWIGLVPKQHSSGGKDRLGSISKQGDRYLRSLFVAGALAVIRYAKIHGTKHRPRLRHCWGGARPRSPPSRLPTRLRAWPGP
jgi:transposase